MHGFDHPIHTPAAALRFDARAAARRVLERCDHLAEFTDEQEQGRLTRLFLTHAAASVHGVLKRWFADAGLSVRVDAAGNLIGHRRGHAAPLLEPEPDAPMTPTFLLGSHLDTVPGSGRYDGVLGVLVALAAVEALNQNPQHRLPFHVDILGFSEEEGVRFQTPYIGSRAVAGSLDPGLLDRKDPDGISLRAALEQFGLDPARLPEAAYDKRHVLGYTEVHIEQGPVLDAAQKPIGVVSGIAGQSRLMMRFTGQAGHAGTVPMGQRRDALVAAAKLAVEVQDFGKSLDGLRATVGFFDTWPNVRNVVPGEVACSLDVRHALDDIRVTAVDALLETAQRVADEDGVTFELLDRQSQNATPVDGGLSGLLLQAAQAADHEPAELPSGSGHDAVIMADLCPVSMLFVRQPDGDQHYADEVVSEADVAAAIETMANYLLHLAQAHADGTLAR
ncbi:MAG: Zn-dependent hydrolase [Planctomycetota bacterium]